MRHAAPSRALVDGRGGKATGSRSSADVASDEGEAGRLVDPMGQPRSARRADPARCENDTDKASERLAPARGVALSMLIGGLMWIALACLL